jgi:hypothetical protein
MHAASPQQDDFKPGRESEQPFAEPDLRHANDGRLQGACPSGFEPRAGENTGFPSDGAHRSFVVALPEDVSTPRPVLVVIPNQADSTLDAMTTRSALTDDLLPLDWVLIGPVRACSSSASDDPDHCLAPGSDGWLFEPWNDQPDRSDAGMKWWDDEGPDARFIKAIVHCAASKWNLDRERIFVAGTARGATMVHRLLTFQSDFWAGGIAVEGDWLPGDTLHFGDHPEDVVPGCCGPLPEAPAPLGAMLVVDIYGGERAGCFVDYAASPQAASNYYASQANVAHVACTSEDPWTWPRVSEFNRWLADLLYAHPKGSTRAPNDSTRLVLPRAAPMPIACEAGRFTTLFDR